jgi:hypothetical protein
MEKLLGPSVGEGLDHAGTLMHSRYPSKEDSRPVRGSGAQSEVRDPSAVRDRFPGARAARGLDERLRVKTAATIPTAGLSRVGAHPQRHRGRVPDWPPADAA